jgi:hypothetical protein
MGTVSTSLAPKVLLLEDKMDVINSRAREMITGTWNDIQAGGKGKFRRPKRALVTYFDSAIRTATGVDATEKLVNIGTGIAMAIFVSGALAASIGSLGAVPAAIVIGACISILSKKIFAAVRAFKAKSLALKKIGEYSATKADPEIKDYDVAAAFLTELYKDIRKIDSALARIHGTSKPAGVNLKTTYFDVKQVYKASDKLTERDWLFRKVEITDKKKLAGVIGARLHSVDTYCEWLQKYCTALSNASVDLQDSKFETLENDIMHLVFWQFSASVSHTNCSSSNCYGPAHGDVKSRPLTEQEIIDFKKKSKLFSQFAGKQSNAAGLYQRTSGAPVDIDDDFEGSFGDAAKDFVKDYATDVGFDHAVDAIGGEALDSVFDHGGAVLGGHVTFVLSSGVAMARQIRQKQEIHARSGKIRQCLMSSDDMKTIEKEFDELMKDLNSAKILRILTLCAHHYPGRIEERFTKMKSALEKINSRNPFQFKTCDEAQKFVRYLLKVHHYVGKQLTYTAILQVWVATLRKTAFHE